MIMPYNRKGYLDLSKYIKLKIHNTCFKNTKKYLCFTGWRLNKIIAGLINSIWKIPALTLWYSMWLLVKVGFFFLIMCALCVGGARGGD